MGLFSTYLSQTLRLDLLSALESDSFFEALTLEAFSLCTLDCCVPHSARWIVVFLLQDATAQPAYQMAASLRVPGISGQPAAGLAKVRLSGNGNLEILYQDRVAHTDSVSYTSATGPRIGVTMQVGSSDCLIFTRNKDNKDKLTIIFTRNKENEEKVTEAAPA